MIMTIESVSRQSRKTEYVGETEAEFLLDRAALWSGVRHRQAMGAVEMNANKRESEVKSNESKHPSVAMVALVTLQKQAGDCSRQAHGS